MEIIFNNISYSNENFNILHNLNFSILHGKTNFIYGNSGSGKTSLLNVLIGYNKYTSGNIKINDSIIDYSDKNIINSIRKNISFMFQFSEEQVFNDTVFDELTFNLSSKIYSKEEKYNLAKSALFSVCLDESYLYKKISNLSNSTKRKIVLANILINDQETIILDEPTINFDDNDRAIFLKIIKILKDKGKTIIIVSHDIDLFYPLIDNFVILHNGCNILNGNKSKLISHSDILNYYNIYIPFLIDFSNIVLNNKNIDLGYFDDVRDLMKAIYRNV